MKTEKVQQTENNDFLDPIGDLRRALNEEILKRDDFHRFYNQLKKLPMFFEIAKNRRKE